MKNHPDPLNHLVEITANVANAFSTVLYVVQPEQQTLVHRASLSLTPNFDPEVKFSYGEGYAGRVAQTMEALLLDTFDHPGTYPAYYKEQEEVRGLIAVPVVYEELEGVLILDTKERYGFTTKLQKIISGIAQQFADMLHKEKLYRQGPAPEIFPYETMIRFSETLLDSPEPMVLAERLVNIPRDLVDCDATAFVWFSGEEDPGKVLRYQGWSRDLSKFKVVPGKGLAGSCAKGKMPLLISNTQKRPSVLFVENEKLEIYQSRLAIPILRRGRISAVFTCACRNPNALGSADLSRLALVASFASNSLECSNIKQQLEFEKNLDPITKLPNHRYLAVNRESIEEEYFNQTHSVCVLLAEIRNLPQLYETHGVDMGDKLLQHLSTMLSNVVSQPRKVFKYSDDTYLILLLGKQRKEIESLETRMRHVFDENPVYIGDRPIRVSVELGTATYPEDGKTFGELIGVCRGRTNQPLKVIP